MHPFLNNGAPIALAFILAAALTPLVRALARRRNIVAQPKADRWHKKPTALLGGVAIMLSVLAVMALFGPHTPQALAVLAGSSFLFLVGLIDDFRQLKPYQKLIAQVMVAALVILSGLVLPWTPWEPLNMAVTLLWLVAITNAVNLLDNMDGLAAGIAAIAATFLSIAFWTTGQTDEAVMLATFAAALVGFLIYNTNPASIFMGDCGSMFAGFFLASAALLSNVGGRSRSLLPVLAVPVLILLIPIFDTTLVTLLRKLSGRAISKGGRDHTSHRLVALGMSERRAVLMLYGLAVLAGLLALSVRHMPVDIGAATLCVVTVALTILGIYLADVSVYDAAEVHAARQKPLVAFLVDVSYKRRVFEVLLDVVLIVLSYFCAYTLMFGSVSNNGAWPQFLLVAPILVAVKLPALLVMGVYRGLWKYVGIDDLVVFGKAVLVASIAAAVVLLMAFRFQGFSRAVWVLDGLILLVLLAASRSAFRILRCVLPASVPPGDCPRVLIYGAGDSGELLLRELRNDRTPCDLVGFVDDDPLKEGKLFHGLKVFAGNGSLRGILEQQQIDEVIISSRKFTEDRVSEIRADCHHVDVMLKRMHIVIEQLQT